MSTSLEPDDLDMAQDDSTEQGQTPQKPATFQGQLRLESFLFNESPSSSSGSSQILNRNRTAPPTLPIPAQSPSQTSPPARPSSKRRAISLETETPPPETSQTQTNLPKNKKKKRLTTSSSSYAPPSTYAHLPHLPDAILPNLLVFFVGLNPGLETARTGHTYAHPSNLFWKLLFSSGITPRRLQPTDDRSLPALYSLGFTNIVSRPSRNGAELSKREMDDGVAALEDKTARWRPECVCIVGKSIWESICRVRRGGRGLVGFKYGWQDESENMGVVVGGETADDGDGDGDGNGKGWRGARVFVATSTSGLAASLSPAEKERIWGELGAWVKMRRVERGIEEERRQVEKRASD